MSAQYRYGMDHPKGGDEANRASKLNRSGWSGVRIGMASPGLTCTATRACQGEVSPAVPCKFADAGEIRTFIDEQWLITRQGSAP